MRLWQLICTFALLTTAASSCNPPPPTAVYLSLDGIGSAEETNRYYALITDPIRDATLKSWKDNRCFPPDKFPEDVDDKSLNGQLKAFYYNPSDLGLGREMRCAKCPKGDKNAGLISCVVSNHGPLDGPTLGIALANRLKKPENLNPADPAKLHEDLRKAISHESLEIVDEFLGQSDGPRTKFRRQTVAMEFNPTRAPDDQVRFYIYDAEDPKFLIPPNTVVGGLIPGLGLDNEGVKFIRNCTYCHGGTFDPNTNLIRGSSFLDFNLAYLAYGDSPELLLSGQDKKLKVFADRTSFKNNQTRLKLLNDLVKETIDTNNPALAPAIRDRIVGSNYVLDTSASSKSGVKSDPDFLPKRWAGHADLFKTVVLPYCATCHFSQSSNYNLRPLSGTKDLAPLTFSTFEQWNRADIQLQIQQSVCGSGDMPHAEVTRLNFLADPVAFGKICSPASPVP